MKNAWLRKKKVHDIPLVFKTIIRQCPVCNENRVTMCIHGKLTYLCGYSKKQTGADVTYTTCHGSYYVDNYEIVVGKING